MKIFWLTSFLMLGLLFLLIFVQVDTECAPEEINFVALGEGQQLVTLDEFLAKYDSIKIHIKAHQWSFGEYYRNATTGQKKRIREQAKEFILQKIEDALVPYWKDTEWDFNGTTPTPRIGPIACGYFVTTLLQHAGFDIDRYFLSRASSTVMIKNLCNTKSIQKFNNNDFNDFLSHIQKAKEGIYIIGLDKHAGMIVKSKEKTMFVHSRKPRHVGVIIEKVEDSVTLQKSKVYVVGSLLENEELIAQWLSVGTKKPKKLTSADTKMKKSNVM